MRPIFVASLVLAVAGCASSPPATDARHETLPLLPMPAQVEPRAGHFLLNDGARLAVDSRDGEAPDIARRFATRLAQLRGLRLDVRPSADAGSAHAAIVFSLAPDNASVPNGEGYELTVEAQHIRVAARDARGLFYGGVTLSQLLTRETTHAASIDVPALRIVDQPRFAWRGAMLDSVRHFQPPEFVKRFIDQLAQLKLNTFHWHLTDDQGWRIEIPRYPRLTEVGAWRRPAGAAGTDANGKPVRYGGYYTQEQIRDIVRYAAERNITIVPEIDMPGHMQAAIAAYPELGSLGDKPVVSPDWGVHSYLLNTDDATFTFMQNVLDDVMQLFPGTYIHIGGDEAVKDQWKASPREQARMHKLGLPDEDHLQAWFVARLQKYLAAHGRRLIGWDEILEGGLPADATVMSWRGAQGGIDAAKQGHDVVMAPSPDLYLDRLQSDADDEPSGRPDLRTLADIYAYQPTPAGIDADAARHVLGAQATLFTEHMRTTAMVEHAAFPRLAALAEVLWSPASTHDWNGFVARLVPQMDRWRAQGIAAADSAFEVRFADDYERADARVRVTLSNQVALPIRYTLDNGRTDGSDPTAASPLYREPLQLPLPSTLRAATFLGPRRTAPAQTRELTPETLLSRSSAELKQCAGKLVLRLADSESADTAHAFYNVDLFDPCWLWPAAPLDGIAAIRVRVARLPYNFQLAHDVANIVPRPASESKGGELLVKRDGCSGSTLARMPLESVRDNPASVLETPLPAMTGAHDLCFAFAGSESGALWAIDDVMLIPAPEAP